MEPLCACGVSRARASFREIYELVKTRDHESLSACFEDNFSLAGWTCEIRRDAYIPDLHLAPRAPSRGWCAAGEFVSRLVKM